MSNKKVFLYVEDDPPSREVMRIMIKNFELTSNLVIFEDSHDFMQRLKALPKQPHMILLDVHLQPYDGFAVLDMVRADSECQSTKVVALTASVMNEEIEKLKHSGFDGAIGKPLNARLFPTLLTRLFDGQSVWYVS
jgi:CheY-like chemotaxis protein